MSGQVTRGALEILLVSLYQVPGSSVVGDPGHNSLWAPSMGSEIWALACKWLKMVLPYACTVSGLGACAKGPYNPMLSTPFFKKGQVKHTIVMAYTAGNHHIIHTSTSFAKK